MVKKKRNKSGRRSRKNGASFSYRDPRDQLSIPKNPLELGISDLSRAVALMNSGELDDSYFEKPLLDTISENLVEIEEKKSSAKGSEVGMSAYIWKLIKEEKWEELSSWVTENVDNSDIRKNPHCVGLAWIKVQSQTKNIASSILAPMADEITKGIEHEIDNVDDSTLLIAESVLRDLIEELKDRNSKHFLAHFERRVEKFRNAIGEEAIYPSHSKAPVSESQTEPTLTELAKRLEKALQEEEDSTQSREHNVEKIEGEIAKEEKTAKEQDGYSSLNLVYKGGGNFFRLQRVLILSVAVLLLAGAGVIGWYRLYGKQVASLEGAVDLLKPQGDGTQYQLLLPPVEKAKSISRVALLMYDLQSRTGKSPAQKPSIQQKNKDSSEDFKTDKRSKIKIDTSGPIEGTVFYPELERITRESGDNDRVRTVMDLQGNRGGIPYPDDVDFKGTGDKSSTDLYTVIVDTDVRDKPSYFADVIGRIRSGSRILVEGVIDGGEWLKIISKNGRIGYILGQDAVKEKRWAH